MVVGIIPAAGKGTRLRPVTDFMPKELLLYGGKPFIGHCVDSLKSVGLDKVVVVVGHQKGVIMDYLKDGGAFGVDIHYAYQTSPKGLGDAILAARTKAENGEPLFILLADDVVEPKTELSNLLYFFDKLDPFGFVLVEEVDDPSHFGVVNVENFDGNVARITEFFEKPTKPQQARFKKNGKFYVICGSYIISNRIFEYLRETPSGKNDEVQLTDALQLALVRGEKIYAYKLDGKRIEVGNPKNYLLEQYYFFKEKDKEDIEELSKDWG